MAATRSARERKASASAGSLATVRIELAPDDSFVYKIHCTECTNARPGSGERQWGTQRRGEDNGYMAAMDRWIFHLVERHPDAEAPCLAYRDEATERSRQRRAERGA